MYSIVINQNSIKINYLYLYIILIILTEINPKFS